MQNLFETLVSLLGKSRSTSKDRLAKLTKELKDTPVIDSAHNEIWFYDFKKTGIKLTFDNLKGMFVHANLCLHTEEVKYGGIKAYEGDLPYGIVVTDNKDEVELKLPGATWSVKDYRFAKDLRPLEILFSFNSNGERITMISLDYIEKH